MAQSKQFISKFELTPKRHQVQSCEPREEANTPIGPLRIVCGVCENCQAATLRGNTATEEEYKNLQAEALDPDDHSWGNVDATKHYFVKLYRSLKKSVGMKPDYASSSLAQYKDSWVTDNKTTIILLSRIHELPPEILAGIAWTEAGGDAPIKDNLGFHLRAFDHMADPYLEPITITHKSSRTSFGDIEIQLRNVATVQGMDTTKELPYSKQKELIKLLENEQFNLVVVIKYLSAMLKQIYPNYCVDDIDDYKFMLSGYLYNMGYPHKLLGKDVNLAVPGMKGISNYGHDLIKKKDKMRKLLGLQ